MAKQIIIIVIVVVLLGVGGYLLYTNSSPAPASIEANSKSIVVGNQIISQLTKLGSLELDEKVFSNPVYNQLVNYGRDITLKPVGKDNPFSASLTSSTKNTSSGTTSVPSVTLIEATTSLKTATTSKITP